MDLWNLFLKRTFSIPSLNYCLLGRWLRHMPGGTLRLKSLVTHAVFGFGLYLCARGVSSVLQIHA